MKKMMKADNSKGLIYSKQHFLNEVKNGELFDDLESVGPWRGCDAYVADTNGNDCFYRMQILVNEKCVMYDDSSLTDADIENDPENLEIELNGYFIPFGEFPIDIDQFRKWLHNRVDNGIEQGQKNFKESKKQEDVLVEDVPEWALNYIINGEADDLQDYQVEMIDDWMIQNKIKSVDPDFNDRGFNSHPAFGKPCTTVSCAIIIGD